MVSLTCFQTPLTWLRRQLVLSALLFVCPVLLAQQALTNDGVLKLVKSGMAENVVISAINTSPGEYDTSANGLVALKTGGATDREISAILLKASGPGPRAAYTGPDPDDPNAPHEPGIYLYDESAPAGQRMTMLEPDVYTQGKADGMFASAMTFGIAKVKMKAVMRGAHAVVQAAVTQPVFYFYFEQTSAGLSHASSIFQGTSTPNEYTLLKFDIKGDARETTIGEVNAFSASGGTANKSVTPFTYTRLRPGVYKVILKQPLAAGEYGFVASGGAVPIGPYASTTNSRVFDFGRN